MPTEEEWIRIYRETLTPLYQYISRRAGGDRSLAEDASQETWLRALPAWRRSGFPREPLAWLKTVARNLLANHYRRSAPLRLREIDVSGEESDLSPRTPESAALVHWGLERLQPEQGRLIEAFHLDGRSIREIAADTGLSERAVEGRLHRARRALGGILGAHARSDRNGDER